MILKQSILWKAIEGTFQARKIENAVKFYQHLLFKWKKRINKQNNWYTDDSHKMCTYLSLLSNLCLMPNVIFLKNYTVVHLHTSLMLYILTHCICHTKIWAALGRHIQFYVEYLFLFMFCKYLSLFNSCTISFFLSFF